MKRHLVPVAILAALAFPGVASAHTPHVTAACGGLVVDLTNYEGGDANNSITVNVDGVATTVFFGTHYYHGYAWDMSVAHQYEWSINANIVTGNPTQYDVQGSGNWQPCAPPTTTTSTTIPPTTTTPATTTADPTTTVAVTDPPVPTISPTVPTPPSTLPASLVLPVTGSSAQLSLGIAIGLLAGGGVLMSVTRRKPQP